MALNKNYTLQIHDQSIVLSNAYCKVLRVLGTKNDLSYDVNVLDEKDGKSYQVLSFKFIPDMDGGNFIAQAYEHLKTLPEFAGAADC
jgi:hypothetical protein